MNDAIGNFIVYLIIILAVLVIFFLICREIVCWYFKINERISQQSLIIDLLKDIKTSCSQFNKQVATQIAEENIQKPSSGSTISPDATPLNTSQKIVSNSNDKARCSICKQLDNVANLQLDSKGLYCHQKCPIK
jgi:hypothetical protein